MKEGSLRGEPVYKQLSEVLLAQIILFNRRRSGESQRMKLSDFQKALKSRSEPDDEIQKALSKFEIHLCKTHTRIETKGKRGRKVPVLLTEIMLSALEALVAMRASVAVKSEYLFGRPGSAKTPYRGNDCIRFHANKCGAKHPSLINSTGLRKQLGTLSQVLSLSDNSQDILASFMGHDIRVHRQFYRLPEDTLQVAKVTKVLHAVNQGQISKSKAKDFDEIEFTPEGLYQK